MSVPSGIIVIGTGVFGISTAIALGERHPESKVTVIDRFEPPVADQSSVDTTRCLRTDYTNSFYADLAKESMDKIKADPLVGKYFHQCGMSVVYDGKDPYRGDHWDVQIKCAKELAGEDRVVMFDTHEEVFRSIHKNFRDPVTAEALGRETVWNKGYCNLDNGVIEADRAMKAYYEKAQQFSNIEFVFTEVEKIVYKDGTNEAKGVKLANGEELLSDLVIVAAGAWSAKLVDLEGVCKIAGIEVAWFKVTPEEAESLKDMSITTNLCTGINTFPPINGEIKILRRSPGYKNTVEIDHPDPMTEGRVEISVPRTFVDKPEDWIPEQAEAELRDNMREIFPFLADRPFDRTKLCFVSQTPSANFIVDHHPNLKNVVLATGGSAHAWKFVALLGDKVVDLLEGHLEETLKSNWSWGEKMGKSDNGSAGRLPGEAQEMEGVMRTRESVLAKTLEQGL